MRQRNRPFIYVVVTALLWSALLSVAGHVDAVGFDKNSSTAELSGPVGHAPHTDCVACVLSLSTRATSAAGGWVPDPAVDRAVLTLAAACIQRRHASAHRGRAPPSIS